MPCGLCSNPVSPTWLTTGLPGPLRRKITKAVADPAASASFLVLFAPSAGNTTAIDRLTGRRAQSTAAERGAISAFCQSRFRALRVEARQAERRFILREVTTGASLYIVEDHLTDSCIGRTLAGQCRNACADRAAGHLSRLRRLDQRLVG